MTKIAISLFFPFIISGEKEIQT